MNEGEAFPLVVLEDGAVGDCENCGRPGSATINGRAMCSDPGCIDTVIGSAMGVVKDALSAHIREEVSRHGEGE